MVDTAALPGKHNTKLIYHHMAHKYVAFMEIIYMMWLCGVVVVWRCGFFQWGDVGCGNNANDKGEIMNKQKMLIVGEEKVPPKLLEIMQGYLEKHKIRVHAIHFIDYITDQTATPVYGRTYLDLNTIAICVQTIVDSAIQKAEEDTNTFSFRALIWVELLVTMFHEIKHLLQHVANEKLDEEEADKFGIETAFGLAKYQDMELPVHLSEWGTIREEILDFEGTWEPNSVSVWEKTQLACLAHGCLEYNLAKESYVPTFRHMASLHFNDDDPAWQEPYPSEVSTETIPETVPETVPETANAQPNTVDYQANPNGNYAPIEGAAVNYTDYVDYNYDDYADDYTQPQQNQQYMPQQNYQQYSPASTTAPEPVQLTPEAQALQMQLDEMYRRFHNHMYTKCGWDPTTLSFTHPAQVVAPVYLADLPLLQKFITTYDGLDTLGNKLSELPFQGHISGRVKNGSPYYRIHLCTDEIRLIKTSYQPDSRWATAAKNTGVTITGVFINGSLRKKISQANPTAPIVVDIVKTKNNYA